MRCGGFVILWRKSRTAFFAVDDGNLMPEAKITIGEKEVPLGEGVVVVGRSPENPISFPEDTNVYRNHAEIESRDAEYWLIDLKSVNGTDDKGQKVTGEMLLQN